MVKCKLSIMSKLFTIFILFFQIVEVSSVWIPIAELAVWLIGNGKYLHLDLIPF